MMGLRDRWKGFKERRPSTFYSYVWWEELLSYYFGIGCFSFFIAAVLTKSWVLWAIGLLHIPLNFWWDRREILNRKNYPLPWEETNDV